MGPKSVHMMIRMTAERDRGTGNSIRRTISKNLIRMVARVDDTLDGGRGREG